MPRIINLEAPSLTEAQVRIKRGGTCDELMADESTPEAACQLIVLRRRLYRESTNCHQCPDGEVFQRHFLLLKSSVRCYASFPASSARRAFPVPCSFHNSCPPDCRNMTQLHYGSSTLLDGEFNYVTVPTSRHCQTECGLPIPAFPMAGERRGFDDSAKGLDAAKPQSA